MKISDMRFPRQLEADGSADMIRGVLMARTAKLWARGRGEVPVVALSEPLKAVLQQARGQGRIRIGFEPILRQLAGEKKGIAGVREQANAPYGDRISRLLFFSNDGAERFYRNIEQLLEEHAPRVLGCLLDADSAALGGVFSNSGGSIKIVMAEHKDVVADVLRIFNRDSAHF